MSNSAACPKIWASQSSQGLIRSLLCAYELKRGFQRRPQGSPAWMLAPDGFWKSHSAKPTAQQSSVVFGQTCFGQGHANNCQDLPKYYTQSSFSHGKGRVLTERACQGGVFLPRRSLGPSDSRSSARRKAKQSHTAKPKITREVGARADHVVRHRRLA